MERNETLKSNSRRLRKEMTKEESLLWYNFLSKYPIRFRRQYIIGNYIVDFYCHKAKLVVELDGSQHCETQTILYDKTRTDYLESQGLLVLRISNLDILRQFEDVCSFIHFTVQHRTNSFSRGEAVERKRD
jgi:very-short-patch-repair endonuclease